MKLVWIGLGGMVIGATVWLAWRMRKDQREFEEATAASDL